VTNKLLKDMQYAAKDSKVKIQWYENYAAGRKAGEFSIPFYEGRYSLKEKQYTDWHRQQSKND
jgi:hypothetical protein